MRILSFLLFISLSLCSIISEAGESVDKSLPLNNATKVSIENLRGHVEIVGTDADVVTVTGELDEKAESFTFEQDGTRINIKVKMPRNMNSNWNQKGSDLKIHVPSQVRIDFTGVSTSVAINNFSRSVDIKTVSGDIVAKELAGSVDLATVSGEVRSNSLSGKISLATVSGEVVDNKSSGRLSVRAVSGDISIKSQAKEVFLDNVSGEVDATLGLVDELRLSVVSGDFDGELNLSENGSVKMSSVSGDLALTFSNKVQASFKLQTSAGGRLINNLTSDEVQRAKYGPGAKLIFDTGNGDASVRATTVSGRIKVSKD